VVGRYAGLEDDIVRITKIRIGDIYRDKGDYEKAVENYREAEKYRLSKEPGQEPETRRGMLSQIVGQFTKLEQFDEAQRWLDIWEWEFPVDKLAGPLSLASGDIAFARGLKLLSDKKAGDSELQFNEAKKRYLQLADINPLSPAAAECLYQAARCAVRLTDPALTKKLLTRLVENYPDDPRCEDAKQVLAKLK
jgi:tetratricopeptide (TPR) repeat protein